MEFIKPSIPIVTKKAIKERWNVFVV